MSSRMHPRKTEAASRPPAQRVPRFIVSAPADAGATPREPDFSALGATVVNRSSKSWLVQGPSSAQALSDALEAAGLAGWSVHPERFYRLA